MNSQQAQVQTGYAAVFIDFENLYYHHSKQFVDCPDLNDALFDLLRNLRMHLEHHRQVSRMIIR